MQERRTGDTCEGEFVNGKEQGAWRLKFQTGSICEGDYVNGRKHGMWTENLSNGNIERGMFAGGKKTGPWRSIRKDGIRWETTFQDGVMDHAWRPVCTEQPSSARSALNSFSSPQSGTLLQQTQFRRPSPPRKPSETPPLHWWCTTATAVAAESVLFHLCSTATNSLAWSGEWQRRSAWARGSNLECGK